MVIISERGGRDAERGRERDWWQKRKELWRGSCGGERETRWRRERDYEAGNNLIICDLMFLQLERK